MQIGLLQKVFLFSSKLVRGWEELSWLVNKEHLFQKINFSKRFNSLNPSLCRPLTLQISPFSKICHEVLFIILHKNEASFLLEQSAKKYCILCICYLCVRIRWKTIWFKDKYFQLVIHFSYFTE